jgi:hypothetical protein
MVNETMKTPRWIGTFISEYPHKKMYKCQESKTTLAIFGMIFYYSLLLYGTYFLTSYVPNFRSLIDFTFCRYACGYGPKDNRGNPNHHRSIKKNRLIQFSIKRLYTRPKVAKIIFYH